MEMLETQVVTGAAVESPTRDRSLTNLEIPASRGMQLPQPMASRERKARAAVQHNL